MERFLQSSLSFTDFEDLEFTSVPQKETCSYAIKPDIAPTLRNTHTHTHRAERERGFWVPLEEEEDEEIVETDRGSEERLETKEDIVAEKESWNYRE